MDELDVSGGAMIHPLRIATTGRTFSPGAFLTLELIGQEAVVQRLERAVEFIEDELDG
jgi:glutamyl-tRNA synthetase